MIALTVITGLLLVAALLTRFKLEFYREYFREKQRNGGKDPDETLRSEFGRFWRFWR